MKVDSVRTFIFFNYLTILNVADMELFITL